MLYGSIFDDLKDLQFRDMAKRLGHDRVILYKGQAEQNWISFLGQKSGFKEDEWQELPSVVRFFGWPGTVSVVMWAALIINHVLMTAHRYKLLPVTPHIIFDGLLRSKIRRIYKQLENEEIKKYLERPGYKDIYSGFEMAVLTFPNFELLSFEDVLELRLTLGDELAAFRKEMYKFAEIIKLSPWEIGFKEHVEHVVENRIQPAVHELQRKLESIKQESLMANLNIINAPNVLAMMACIHVGIPPILVAALSAGLITLETIREYFFERKKLFESNGLSLLLRFQ
jgi:hypothetical protein